MKFVYSVRWTPSVGGEQEFTRAYTYKEGKKLAKQITAYCGRPTRLVKVKGGKA